MLLDENFDYYESSDFKPLLEHLEHIENLLTEEELAPILNTINLIKSKIQSLCNVDCGTNLTVKQILILVRYLIRSVNLDEKFLKNLLLDIKVLAKKANADFDLY